MIRSGPRVFMYTFSRDATRLNAIPLNEGCCIDGVYPEGVPVNSQGRRAPWCRARGLPSRNICHTPIDADGGTSGGAER